MVRIYLLAEIVENENKRRAGHVTVLVQYFPVDSCAVLASGCTGARKYLSGILPGGAGAVIRDTDHILDGLNDHGACEGEETSEQEVAFVY
jgi:hypothetical protein